MVEFDFSEDEARANKIYRIWLEQRKKVFPNYNHARAAKGDPRKSLIFKICYKLQRETKGLLEEKDYLLYVRAQLDVLRHLVEKDFHPSIDAGCLVGEKAWKRWKLWKKKYDARTKEIRSAPVSAPVQKVRNELERTKEFLTKTMGEINADKFKEAVINRNLFRWVSLGKISPYYVAISPIIKKVINLDDFFDSLNLEVKNYLISEEVLNIFKEFFPNE
jgi:hypothetical protein